MVVMSIAGADPSGGAGVFADLKTFHTIGVYGCGIITCLTAQNPYTMFSVKEMGVDYVKEQIDAVMDAYDITFVKTGMLYSEDIIKLVANLIDEYDLNVVVDPVMIASSGGDLTKNSLVGALKKYLLPKSILTTPNIFEAERISGMKITCKDDAAEASKTFPCDCLITGGHLDGINTLNLNGKITVKKQDLLKSNNLHGTGCTLSSAIVAYLDKGENLKTSCFKSFNYVYEAIKNGVYGTLVGSNID